MNPGVPHLAVPWGRETRFPRKRQLQQAGEIESRKAFVHSAGRSVPGPHTGFPGVLVGCSLGLRPSRDVSAVLHAPTYL